MASITSGRRLVVAAVAMIIVGQVLAIANDVFLRQSDPSDVVMLVLLVALSVPLLRRARWARWVTVVLVTLGGVLELASVVLLIATKVSPGIWPEVDAAVPALVSLHAAVVAFIVAQAFPLLVASLLISAVLDLTAAGVLVFAPAVRAYFVRDAASVTG
jgi:hypothetical protein